MPSFFSKLIKEEKNRILTGINLIASENYPSKNVFKASGSIFSTKYAEGYPGQRYYSGCKFVDLIERKATDLAKELFGAEYANLQPHSGSQANHAVLEAFLAPGEKILAMAMDSGGHLTHGHKKNFSGKHYDFVFYAVSPETQLIDYDQILKLTLEHKPKIILAGGSAYPDLIDFEKLKKIASQVGALLWIDMAHFAGMVAAKLIPSPFPFADIVTSTTHKTLRGPRGGMILAKEEFGKRINQAVMPGIQGGPAINLIAAKGICFSEAMTQDFKRYQEKVLSNAKTLADHLTRMNYFLTTGSTKTHLILIDLKKSIAVKEKNLTGKDAEIMCEQNNVFINRNLVPFDTMPPLLTSGIRLGLPAITTLGIENIEMNLLAEILNSILTETENKNLQKMIYAFTKKYKQDYF